MFPRVSARRAHASRGCPGAASIALVLSFLVAATVSAAPLRASTPFATPAAGTRTAGTNGTWQQLPPPLMDQAAAAYDPAHQRMVMYGGQDENRMVRGDLWALSLAGSPQWSLLATTGSTPGPRLGHVLVHDPLRNRLLLFGGYSGADSMTHDDVWALSLDASLQWTRLTPTGAPPSRRVFAAAVYDSANDRVVVFGGADSLEVEGAPMGFRNDVWALALAGTPAWSQLSPTGTPPSARAGAAMIYDLARERAVLFDGFDGSVMNDGFTLSLGGSPAWAPLGATGGPPPARVLCAAAYDAPDDRVVYFGGLVDPSNNTHLGDVWSLSLGSPAWTQLAPSGTAPTARAFMSSIYDTPRDRLVIFGGQDANDLVTDPAWALSLGATPAWADLGSDRPPAREGQAAGYDHTGNVMVVHGGRDRNGNMIGDAWSVALGPSPQWTLLAPTGTPLGKRIGHSCIYDAVRSRYLFFGGSDTLTLKNDLWSLTLGGTPEWTKLSPAGTPPSARIYHTAVYDSLGDRMVVFGGQAGIETVNDVWALSLAGTPTWTQLAPTGTPPSPRASHAAAIDRAGNRMIVFGGLIGGDADNGTYALTLGGSPAWTVLSPAGTPPLPRSGASMVSTGSHMVVYGGQPWGGGNTVYDDAWFLTLYPSPEWLLLDVGPTLPGGRRMASVAFDDVAFAMYAFGGRGSTETMNDLWLLALDEATPVEASLVRAHAEPGRVELEWHLASSSTRATVYRRPAGGDWAAIATGVADGTGRLSFVDRAVDAGSRYGYRLGIAADGAEAYAGEVWIDVPAAARLALAGLTPNPARSRAALAAFTLPDASAARLELLDVGGRRVFSREVGSLGAGAHVLALDRTLPAGLYFVRLTRGGESLVTRAAIVK